MKANLTLFMLFFLVANTAKGQESGNANYGNNKYYSNQVSTIQTTSSTQDEMIITIRGIYNERATSKIAVFSILQLGKTAAETTSLMDERITDVINQIQQFNKEIEVVTDMISFVPMYEYEVEKKIFNPKTYNEKPSGFELKKNLIVKYKTHNAFDKIIAICAKQEIYDLAKVDYTTNNFASIKDQLQNRAIEEFKKTLSNYSLIMNIDLTKKEKIVQEGFNVSYPMESYQNYQAYSQANANFDKKNVINNVVKNTTQYYNSVPVKSHTFIINPEIASPAIQIFYDLTIRIKLKEDQLPKNTIQKNNKYYVITATGDIKLLNI
ncbi:MAG TPA: SIMPL domain-containing protein [Flavobacterium sp.]|jgi:hypothetical protein